MLNETRCSILPVKVTIECEDERRLCEGLAQRCFELLTLLFEVKQVQVGAEERFIRLKGVCKGAKVVAQEAHVWRDGVQVRREAGKVRTEGFVSNSSLEEVLLSLGDET